MLPWVLQELINTLTYAPILPFLYHQKHNYIISHTIWHLNILINKNTPENKEESIYRNSCFNAYIDGGQTVAI
jgi:hypothetical protein